MYIQINIGRNVNGKPLTDSAWNEFRADVITAPEWMAWSVDDRFEQGEITVLSRLSGYCEAWNEDSFNYAVNIPDRYVSVPYLRSRLAELCGKFHQDCIALKVLPDSQNWLVTGNE